MCGGVHWGREQATFDDDLAADALAKRHCTVSEASGVARAMGAKHVILTHLSQRYACEQQGTVCMPCARYGHTITGWRRCALHHVRYPKLPLGHVRQGAAPDADADTTASADSTATEDNIVAFDGLQVDVNAQALQQLRAAMATIRTALADTPADDGSAADGGDGRADKRARTAP